MQRQAHALATLDKTLCRLGWARLLLRESSGGLQLIVTREDGRRISAFSSSTGLSHYFSTEVPKRTAEKVGRRGDAQRVEVLEYELLSRQVFSDRELLAKNLAQYLSDNATKNLPLAERLRPLLYEGMGLKERVQLP